MGSGEAISLVGDGLLLLTGLFEGAARPDRDRQAGPGRGQRRDVTTYAMLIGTVLLLPEAGDATQVAVYVNPNPIVGALLGILGERRSGLFLPGFGPSSPGCCSSTGWVAGPEPASDLSVGPVSGQLGRPNRVSRWCMPPAARSGSAW